MATAQVVTRHHECALCMEQFTSPRLLPCFHTFCLRCLRRLVKSRQRSKMFPCPTCRASTTIPAGGVEKFQVNFYIEAEVEGSGREVHTCNMCRKKPATHKCTDCDQFSCDKCTAIHASIAATKSHTVVQLQNAKGTGLSSFKVTKERYCKTHREEKIRFFCNQCSTVICRDCKLTSHEGHATTDLSAKSSEAKQLISEITKQSRESLELILRQLLREAGDHKENVQAKKKEIQATLEQRAGELKQEIDKILSQAKQKLNKETDSVDETITDCLDTMNQELAQFLSLTEHAERVIRSGCEADILEMPTQMKHFFGEKEAVDARTVQHILYQRVSGSMNSQQLSTGPFDENTSHCKLKSFTNLKWKVAIQVDDVSVTQCFNCSYHYDKTSEDCPNCGVVNGVDSLVVYASSGYLYQKTHVQCTHCRNTNMQNEEFCTYCGTAATTSRPKLATMTQTIGNYIGRVTKSAQSEPQPCKLYGRATQTQGRNSQWSQYQPQVNNTRKTAAESLSSKIVTEINTIQISLSEWQRMGQYNQSDSESYY